VSSNFYDTTGVVVGCDPHKYWMVGPEGEPEEVKAGYANAAQYYVNPAEDPATKTASVTSDGNRMIQGKCKLEKVPHWPVIIPGVPYPVLEPLEIAITFLSSSSAPLLRRQCVTGEGQPLAICISWAISLNLQCGDPVKMPTAIVFNLNSVKTTASWQDLVPTVVDWIIDTLAGKVTKFISKKLLDKYFKKLREDLGRTVERIVKKIAEDQLKGLPKELFKLVKDKLKPKKFLRDLGVPFV
jgi:hypothetical protein